MPSPLILNDRTAIMAPQFCGAIDYYAVMSMYPRVVIDRGMKFDKRFKSAHRHTIADTRGPLTLTVPIVKPDHTSGATWNDIRVSRHGEWWNVHLTSLESAYGRTPFFEFYIDRFKPFYDLRKHQDINPSLMDIDCGIDAVIRRILGIDSEVTYFLPEDTDNIITDDLRDFRSAPALSSVQYYQVRASKLGFIPGLSILDLIFNMGPESPLILRAMTK